VPEFVATLRRLADALEDGKRFTVGVAGERVTVPAQAVFSIAHEREGGNEELEFQVYLDEGIWKEPHPAGDSI
jgi:amphi-Trp domain-containing protein